MVSGSETDVCVLATVLDAVDLGYRVIVVRDAVCSSSDEGHDMLMRPTKFEFVINLKTAKALGFELPISMQLLADEVIE